MPSTTNRGAVGARESLRAMAEAIDADLLARAGVASASSALVAYGLREVLRAVGGGYYCCNHAYFATVGLAIAGLGWLGLLAALQAG
jgi:hypothetical protein